jgi:LDH2 family malate/lactate/ureidoglycolate dehydrogenase
MAAWGGAEKLIGNQAFSIGAPAGRHPSVILDMGLGAASLGVLREAAANGTPLAAGLAADANGKPTIDGRNWAEGGSLLPMGGHRGYGLALMWEVLTGVLSGGHTLTEVGPPDVLDRPTGNCLFILAIDPSAFLP